MVKVVEHPLIKVKLAIMRDEKTVSKEFRESLDEIASLMCFEVFKDIGTHEIEETFQTPTGVTLNKVKLDHKIILAPILRAGIGMVDGVKAMIPTARIGHIGMYRDEETLEPHEYYFKLPVAKDPLVVVCDPMLATGGSAIAAIDAIKKRGYNNIRLMCRLMLFLSCSSSLFVEKYWIFIKIVRYDHLLGWACQKAPNSLRIKVCLRVYNS